MDIVPVGTAENSPAFQGWVCVQSWLQSWKGRKSLAPRDSTKFIRVHSDENENMDASKLGIVLFQASALLYTTSDITCFLRLEIQRTPRRKFLPSLLCVLAPLREILK